MGDKPRNCIWKYIFVVSRKSDNDWLTEYTLSFYEKVFFQMLEISLKSFYVYYCVSFRIQWEEFLVEYKIYIHFQTIQSNPNLGKAFKTQANRFVLPLMPSKSKAETRQHENEKVIVKPEKICEFSCEFPRINNNYLGE